MYAYNHTCICIRICIYMCMYTFIHIFIYMYLYIHIHICICLFVYTYTERMFLNWTRGGFRLHLINGNRSWCAARKANRCARPSSISARNFQTPVTTQFYGYTIILCDININKNEQHIQTQLTIESRSSARCVGVSCLAVSSNRWHGTARCNVADTMIPSVSDEKAAVQIHRHSSRLVEARGLTWIWKRGWQERERDKKVERPIEHEGTRMVEEHAPSQHDTSTEKSRESSASRGEETRERKKHTGTILEALLIRTACQQAHTVCEKIQEVSWGFLRTLNWGSQDSKCSYTGMYVWACDLSALRI